MSAFHLALNVNASPYVPVKKAQWGAIGEEKKKIHELQTEIDRIKNNLAIKETYISDIGNMINKLEAAYKSLCEENKMLKVSNDEFIATNELIKKEKEDIMHKQHNSIVVVNKLWCEQLVNGMLKNSFFTLYHPEIMMIKNETVNNNFNLFPQKIARLFEIIATGMPFAPFMSTY